MMPIGVLLDSRFMSLVTMLGCPTFIIHAFAGVTGDIAMLESSRQRLVQCAQIVECTLSVRSANGERRYSDFLAIASSNTTMEATWNAPPTVLEMS